MVVEAPPALPWGCSQEGKFGLVILVDLGAWYS